MPEPTPVSDPALAAVLAAAIADAGDIATLSALADLLADASAADRLAALGELATLASRVNLCQEIYRGRSPHSKRIESRHDFSSDLSGDEAALRYARGRMRQDAFDALGRALEAGHTYAVFVEEGEGAGHVRCGLVVVPLDGGRVLGPPPGG